MKRHWIGFSLFLIGFCMVLGAPPAVLAQDAKDTFTLDEITVTAERRETNAQDTPVAVSAWDSTTLDEEAIDGIEDLQMRMPSTQFTGNKIYIRGVGRDLNQLGMDPGVGLYEDGFYSTEYGALGDLFDVARVESIRGPQSTLFGRNTIGGLVQIVHTRPKSEFDGQAKLRFGALGSTHLLAFGGPLIDDKLMFRIRARNWDWDGQQKNLYTDDFNGGYDGSTIHLLLLFQPTDKLEFYSRYWFSTAQNSIGAGIRPDPYNAGSTDIWHTYPGDATPTLVRTMDPQTGIVWARDANKTWSFTSAMPHVWAERDATTGLWSPMDDHNPSSDNVKKIAFDHPGFFDFDGQGIQLTSSYEATDSITVKFLTEYRDWWWHMNGDADGAVNPEVGSRWSVPMNIYGYSQELQFIYANPDSRFSFIGGLYYYFKHEVQGYIYSRPGTRTRLILEPSPNAAGKQDWYPADTTGLPYYQPIYLGGNGSTWGWLPHEERGVPWFDPSATFSYDTWIETSDKAIYGQVDFEITKKLNLSAGLRWAEDVKKGYEKLFILGTTGFGAEARYTQAQIDYLSVTYWGGTPPTHGATFGPYAGQVIQAGDHMESARFFWFPVWWWDGSAVQLLQPCGGFCDKPTGTWWGWYPPDNGRELKADWSRTVGKVSLDYKPTDETLLYISYAKGYKAGGFQLGSWAAGDAAGEPTVYDPEILNAYEVGWKQLWFNDRWRTNLTYYLYDYDSLQVETTVDGETGVRNMGDSEVWGIELEGEGYVTDHLLVNFASSFTHAEYLGFRSMNPRLPWEGDVDISGNRMKRIPEWKFAMGATYTLPTQVGDFAINLRYYWQDEEFFTQYNTDADRFKPWDRVGGRIWWSSPDFKWRVTVDMENIMNTVAAMDVSGFGVAGRREWATITERNWGVEISYRF